MVKSILDKGARTKWKTQPLSKHISNIDGQPHLMQQRTRIETTITRTPPASNGKPLFEVLYLTLKENDSEMDKWLRGIAAVLNNQLPFYVPKFDINQPSMQQIDLFRRLTVAWLGFCSANLNRRSFPQLTDELARLEQLCHHMVNWITRHNSPEETQAIFSLWQRMITLTEKRHISPDILVDTLELHTIKADFESRMFIGLPQAIKEWVFSVYLWFFRNSPTPIAKIFSESRYIKLQELIDCINAHNNLPDENGLTVVRL